MYLLILAIVYEFFDKKQVSLFRLIRVSIITSYIQNSNE